MCDKLVFDLSQELEGTSNIFIRKDWINILDNQNGQYSANQCVIDTSQLSNSNKYLNYREAYLSIPLLLTLTGDALLPNQAGTSCDYSIGLKNWFGSIVHSLTVEYNNTSIIQQTPFIGMVNSFRLMTTLSWSDIAIMGSTIGFYPDDALTWSYNNVASTSGIGVCNNSNFSATATGVAVSAGFNNYKSKQANEGFLQRQTYINYDPAGVSGTGAYSGLLTAANASQLFKSFISNKTDAVAGPPIVPGCFQISVRATVYLRHLHSFFNHVPLLKGVYMKMTLNLNNSSCVFTKAATPTLTLVSTDVPVGGIQPLMVASIIASNGNAALPNGTYTASLSVGNICLNSSQRSLAAVQTGLVGNNIFLYVPAYTFNPVFESAYLSSPIKTIDYSDYYQYQILNIGSGVTYNNLITNGISNVKSVLLLPFYTSIVPGGNGVLAQPVYQSPFDPAGTGPTSPMCIINQFNIVVSGQNSIYNTERYSFEHFNNNFQGLGINGAMVDGLSSGLINSLSFEMAYNYYYTNVSRMLPVEESVPKSISCVGINASALPINLWCFVEYGVSISVDILTGARV